jgi:hypothetical protein
MDLQIQTARLAPPTLVLIASQQTMNRASVLLKHLQPTESALLPQGVAANGGKLANHVARFASKSPCALNPC